MYPLKGLELKNKGHTNFYECCDLTEKVYLSTTIVRGVCRAIYTKIYANIPSLKASCRVCVKPNTTTITKMTSNDSR